MNIFQVYKRYGYKMWTWPYPWDVASALGVAGITFILLLIGLKFG